MVFWQYSRESIEIEIRRLERDPAIYPRYVRELRNTWGDIQSAGREWLEWHRSRAASVGGSAEVPQALDVSSSKHPPPGLWWSSSKTAEKLALSERRVRQLCAQERLAAVKPGWAWLIAPAEVWLETRSAA
jgi:hypothetical protein